MGTDLSKLEDQEILNEIGRRFKEKSASIAEMEFMTKKLMELNKQTQEAEKIKGEFLSIIKNEFNNPLSTLLNVAHSLERKVEDEKLCKMVLMLNTELVRLDFHFRNIFAAQEVEAGEIANYFTAIDLQSLYEDVQKPLRYIARDKNLSLKLENQVTEKIVSDGYKLDIIITNLLSNAMEFSYPDKEILLKFHTDDNYFYITVQDQGEGIHVDYQNKVFDRFSKFSTGRTRAHTGLGLGLSIVRGMSEALEGEVNFETREGLTTFTVQLPKQTQDMLSDEKGDSNTVMFDDFDSDDESAEF